MFWFQGRITSEEGGTSGREIYFLDKSEKSQLKGGGVLLNEFVDPVRHYLLSIYKKNPSQGQITKCTSSVFVKRYHFILRKHVGFAKKVPLMAG